jgi:hypothetical protein
MGIFSIIFLGIKQAMEIQAQIGLSYTEYLRLKESDDELKKIKNIGRYPLPQENEDNSAGPKLNDIFKGDESEALEGHGAPWLPLPIQPTDGGQPFSYRAALITKEPPLLSLDVANVVNDKLNMSPEKPPEAKAPVTLDAIDSVPPDMQTTKKRKWFYMGAC